MSLTERREGGAPGRCSRAVGDKVGEYVDRYALYYRHQCREIRVGRVNVGGLQTASTVINVTPAGMEKNQIDTSVRKSCR